MARRTSLLAAAVIALGALGACSKTAPAKTAAAASDSPFVFPHTPHVEGDVPCLMCHAGVDKATAIEGTRHVRLPANPAKNDACSGCHDTDPKVVVPARVKEVRFRFDHAAHLPRFGFDAKKDNANKTCQGCHQKLSEKNDAAAVKPPMSACTACHNHQADFNTARCTPCHVDLKGYKPGSAFNHEGDWLRLHADLARTSAASCAACHDQTYCAECHASQTTPVRLSVIFPENVDRNFIHRGDYVSRHMIEARANAASCNRCHGKPFCESCHAVQNVLARGLPTDRSPHPAGFFQSHGPAARADISSCASCHDNGPNPATNCVTCHKPGGVGGNPHPPSWNSKHDLGDVKNNKMCRACHTGA